MANTAGFAITLIVPDVIGGNASISERVNITATGTLTQTARIDHEVQIAATGKPALGANVTLSHDVDITATGNIITDLTIPAFWPSGDAITYADRIFIDRLEQNAVVGTELRYTLDGTTPDINATAYNGEGIIPFADSFTIKAAYITAADEIVSGTLIIKNYTVSAAPLVGSFLTEEFIDDLFAGNIDVNSKQYKVAFYQGEIDYTTDSTTYSTTGELSTNQCAAYTAGGFALTPSVTYGDNWVQLEFSSLTLPAADEDVGYAFQYLAIFDPASYDDLLMVIDMKRPVVVAADTTPTESIYFTDLLRIDTQQAAA